MSVDLVPAAIAAVLEEEKETIGLTSTFDPPPPALDTAQLPAQYTITGNASYDLVEGSDIIFETRLYRIQVAVVPTGVATPDVRETRCRPLIRPLILALAARPQLGLTTGVQTSRVLSDSGIAVLPEFNRKFIGFEVRLEVVVYIARNYEAYE